MEDDDFVDSLLNTQGMGSSTWTTWSWTAATAGTYQLSYSLKNIADNGTTSYAMFDSATVLDPSSPRAHSWRYPSPGFRADGITGNRPLEKERTSCLRFWL